MKCRAVAAAMIALGLASCAPSAPPAVPIVGTPDSSVISPASSLGESGVLYVTDATKAVTQEAPPGSPLRESALAALGQVVEEHPGESPAAAELVAPPEGHDLVASAAAPSGNAVAAAFRPEASESAGASAEVVTTVVTYEVSTGQEVGRTDIRTWGGGIDLEWAPSSKWLFVTQDDWHVIAFRPEQPARSLRQLNVPHASDFAVVESLAD